LYCIVLCMHGSVCVEPQVQDFTQKCAYVSCACYSILTNSTVYLWWCWSTIDLNGVLTVLSSHISMGDAKSGKA
jgi:hypothetical protein